MHKQLVEQTGGSDKVLDYALLDSVLENPFQTFDGKELYPTIQEKAARLVYHLLYTSIYTFTILIYSYILLYTI